MVSWGQNTVFSFDKTSTPASTSASLSGASPAPPSSGFTFGTSVASPSPAFAAQPNLGATFPANNTTAASSSAFSFGSPSPSTSNLFSSLATPTAPSSPGAGLFGTTSAPPSYTWPPQGSTPTPSTAALPQTYTPGISAALHASMQQEASRLEAHLLFLQTAYSPYLLTPTPMHTAYPMVGSSLPINTQCRFQHVFYDMITPHQQLERLHHYSSRHPNVSKGDAMNLLHTPKPTHFDSTTWNKAQAMNPNPAEYSPVLLSGAEALHVRLVNQHAKVQMFDKYLVDISSSIDKLNEMSRTSQLKLEVSLSESSLLKRKLLDMLRKVEICRARNVPLTTEEKTVLTRVSEVFKQVRKMDETLLGPELDEKVHAFLRMQESFEQSSSSIGSKVDEGTTFTKEEYKNHVLKVLQEQREGVEVLKKILSKDKRDLQIIRNGLSS